MATLADCEQALAELAQWLAAPSQRGGRTGLDRTVSCRIRDLDTTLAGRLDNGHLVDVHRADRSDGDRAQVRLDLTSDDLVALVHGELDVTSAWATKRVRIGASMLDLVRLRSLF